MLSLRLTANCTRNFSLLASSARGSFNPIAFTQPNLKTKETSSRRFLATQTEPSSDRGLARDHSFGHSVAV